MISTARGLTFRMVVGLIAAIWLTCCLAAFAQQEEAQSEQGQSDAASSAQADPAQTDPAQTELPTYLQELQALARERLEQQGESGADDFQSDGRALRVQPGPVSRQEYMRFVGRAEMNGAIEQDSVALSRPVIPKVVVRDRNAIAYLQRCCAYGEESAEAIEFVEIYDFGRSGFSNGDLLVAHPTGNSYVLAGLDPEFLASAATWARADLQEYASFFRETRFMDELVDELAPPEMYDWQAPPPDLDPVTERQQALRAIWAGVHGVVSEQYGLNPLEVHFVRADTTTSIEVWGYAPDSLQFNYVQAGGRPRNDLLTVTVTDTIIESVHSYLDVLVVQDSRVDTVYFAAGGGTTDQPER